MAIGVAKFQRPSRADDTPFWEGLSQALKRQGMRNQNRKQEAELPYAAPMKAAELLMKQLQNQYYGPEKDSLINSRQISDKLTQANTNTANINNQYLPEKLAGLLDQLKITNKFLPDKLQADNDYKKSLTNRPTNGRGVGTAFAGLAQAISEIGKEYNVDEATAKQIYSAILENKNTLPSGEGFEPPSAYIQDAIAKALKPNSNAATQNRAINMTALSNQASKIDIKPLLEFANPNGYAKYIKYKALDAIGSPVPDSYHQFEAFQQVTSSLLQDAERLGFGTSVQPSYVKATLGVASNPGLLRSQSAAQVKENWNKTLEWLRDSAKDYRKATKQGALYGSEEDSKYQKNSNGNDIEWVRRADGTFGPAE